MADLPMGEAQMSQAGRGMCLVPDAVPGLLAWGAVVAKAIRLDDQAEIGSIKVDPETVYSSLGPRLADSRTARDSQEAPLELRVSDYEGGPIEQGT